MIDLRCLRPLDMETVVASVKKTHRALMVEETTRLGGFAGELVSQVQEEAFEYLDAPVGRVAGAEVPIPYSFPPGTDGHPQRGNGRRRRAQAGQRRLNRKGSARRFLRHSRESGNPEISNPNDPSILHNRQHHRRTSWLPTSSCPRWDTICGKAPSSAGTSRRAKPSTVAR